MSVQTIREFRQERAKLVKEARDILDKTEKEKRNLLAEEETKYNSILAKVDEISKKVEREERQLVLETEMAKSGAEPHKPDPGQEPQARVLPRATPEYRAAFNKFLRGGKEVLGIEEMRALQADSDTLGGYLVTPQQFVADLLKAVDDAVVIRSLATINRIERAESLGVPALDTDVSDADWTSELATGSEDTAMKVGKRELRPHPLAKRIKVSQKLLRTSVLDVEALVRNRLAYKFGVSQEKAFMTGDGAEKPLGIFTASANGISTARDISTGNTTTSIQFDGLHEAKYGLKGQYWNKARWIFHRDALKQVAKLKDGEGQYIWRESVRVGEPDRLLNLPYHMSEFAPNTFTTGKYVGILGDFSFYWIADALDMQVQRLVELYAEANQVGFIGRLETDGMPVLEEAFARVKLA